MQRSLLALTGRAVVLVLILVQPGHAEQLLMVSMNHQKGSTRLTYILDLLDAELLQTSAVALAERSFRQAKLGVLKREHAEEKVKI